MAKLTLLCSPERIYSRDNEAGGVWAIGLNLSVASDEPIDEKLLKPWKWPSLIKKIKVSIDGAAQPLDETVEVLKWDHQDITIDSFKEARSEISAYYDVVYTNTKPGFKPDNSTDMRADIGSWPAVIADLSQRPAPVPHFLNLCFYIRIPRASVATGSSICIAPVLPAGILTGAGEAVPANIPTGNGQIRIWPYTSPFAGIDVEAQTESIKLGDAPQHNGVLLDLNRLLVKKDATVQQFNEDWRPQVEQRVALNLDLSAQLIKYLRQSKNIDAPTANAIGAAAIGVMRDCAGAGVGRGPDGQSLVETALRRPYQNNEKSQAESANQRAFSDLATWRDTLRNWLISLDSSGNNLDLLQGIQLQKDEVIRQLDKLHEVVLRPETLRVLVKRQWEKLRESGAQFILDGLPLPSELQLPLAYETANSVWQDFKKSVESLSDRPAVLKALTDAITKYYTDRLTGKTRGYPTVTLAVPQELQDLLAASAAVIADAAIPQRDEVLPTTNVPHGITLQVDRLTSESSDDTASQQDLLRRIRGVGLLMRDDKGTWKSLNMAALCLQIANKVDPKKLDLSVVADPVLVATRLMYVNGVGQPTLAYNNNPLGAKSPLACATDVYLNGSADQHIVCNTEPAAAPGAQAPLFVSEYSTSPLASLMALYFGRKPVALPYIVSTSGILAPELTSDSPIQLRTNLDQVDEQKLQDYIRQLPTYTRRVKVGQIRTTVKQDSLPVIPDNVFPRGREIDPAVFGPEFPPSGDDPHHDRSLLLLAPDSEKQGAHTYRFFVRQPATDLQTWDRYAGESIDQNLRKIVWCYCYAGEQRNRLKGAAPPTVPANLPQDFSIDDPALAFTANGQTLRYFYVELKKEDKSHAPTSPQWVVISAPATNDFTSVQSAPIEVNVNTGDTTKLDCSVAGKITVTVAPGNLCHLQVCACVHDTNTKKFPTTGSDWVWHFPASKPPSGEKYALVSPFNFLIEAAIAKLPTPRQLWDATSISPDQNGIFNDSGRLVVRCDTSPGSNDWGRYVSRIEVLKQVWQWSGRPVNRHPALNDGNQAKQDLDDWEAEEFGARTEGDHVVLPMTRNAGVYVHEENLTTSKDLRGVHCRFRVRAYSRYAGMLPPEAASQESANTDSPQVLGDPASVRWRSAFVPSRRLSDVSPVRVAFVLPLTQSQHTSSKVPSNPGLLVLLNEPWFEVGGLGEELEAEVDFTADPDCPPEEPGKPCRIHYYQYGPDPILNKFDPANALTTEKDKAIFVNIEGPVGHTFDRSIGTQLFVKSSFVLPAPSIERNGKNDVARAWWNFARIRFRRKIQLPRKAGPVYSEFTPYFWAQYLPDFSIFATEDVDVSRLSLAVVGNKLQLVDGTVPKPVNSDSKQFALFVVLTRRAFDAIGSQGQEEFVGIYAQDGDAWSPLDGSRPPTPTDIPQYRARIIEVQSHLDSSGAAISYSNLEEFWQGLLGTMNDQSQLIPDLRRARIVRISEPIDSAEFKASRC